MPLVILSQNPSNVAELVESVNRYVAGISTIYVLYEIAEDTKSVYEELSRRFSTIELIEYTDDLVLNTALSTREVAQDYMIVTTDDCRVIDTIDLCQCIQQLKKTGAYAFYFNLSQKDMITDTKSRPYITLSKDIMAWQFAYANYLWTEPVTLTDYKKLLNNRAHRPLFTTIKSKDTAICLKPLSLQMVLYSKDEFMARMHQKHCLSMNEYVASWQSSCDCTKELERSIGLFYKDAKVELTISY